LRLKTKSVGKFSPARTNTPSKKRFAYFAASGKVRDPPARGGTELKVKSEVRLRSTNFGLSWDGIKAQIGSAVKKNQLQ
ncbi:MAG: hypothetical protein IIX36_02745, partial [Clostridia bacterium]|nr:hypothetical protein [Clostridia bacterium]